MFLGPLGVLTVIFMSAGRRLAGATGVPTSTSPGLWGRFALGGAAPPPVLSTVWPAPWLGPVCVRARAGSPVSVLPWSACVVGDCVRARAGSAVIVLPTSGCVFGAVPPPATFGAGGGLPGSVLPVRTVGVLTLGCFITGRRVVGVATLTALPGER